MADTMASDLRFRPENTPLQTPLSSILPQLPVITHSHPGMEPQIATSMPLPTSMSAQISATHGVQRCQGVSSMPRVQKRNPEKHHAGPPTQSPRKRCRIAPSMPLSTALSSRPAHPHVCPQCSSSFPVKRSLTRHLKSVHGQKGFLCSTCERPFSRGDERDRHEREQHGEKADGIECMICGSRVQERYIDQHFQTRACCQAQTKSDLILLQACGSSIRHAARCTGPLSVGDPVLAAVWGYTFSVAFFHRARRELERPLEITCLRAAVLEFRGLAMRLSAPLWSDQRRCAKEELVATLNTLHWIDEHIDLDQPASFLWRAFREVMATIQHNSFPLVDCTVRLPRYSHCRDIMDNSDGTVLPSSASHDRFSGALRAAHLELKDRAIPFRWM